MSDSDEAQHLADYVQQLERQIATVLRENQLLKAALDALRNH